MKKKIIILGLSAILSCSFMFAINSISKHNDGTKAIEMNVSAECVSWKFREVYGHDEVKIFNNCSSDIIISYKYWTSRWIFVELRVKAGTSSLWLPADNLKDFTYTFDD